jgi:hypothetical protein
MKNKNSILPQSRQFHNDREMSDQLPISIELITAIELLIQHLRETVRGDDNCCNLKPIPYIDR